MSLPKDGLSLTLSGMSFEGMSLASTGMSFDLYLNLDPISGIDEPEASPQSGMSLGHKSSTLSGIDELSFYEL